jgi:hypothetical protein
MNRQGATILLLAFALGGVLGFVLGHGERPPAILPVKDHTEELVRLRADSIQLQEVIRSHQYIADSILSVLEKERSERLSHQQHLDEARHRLAHAPVDSLQQLLVPADTAASPWRVRP